MEKASENVWAKEQSVQLGSFVPNDGSAAATASSCTLRLLTGLPQNGRSFMLQTFTPSLTMNPIARGKISVCFSPLLFFAPPPLSLPSRLLPIFNPPYTPPHYPTYSAYTTCHRAEEEREKRWRSERLASRVSALRRVSTFSHFLLFLTFLFPFFSSKTRDKKKHDTRRVPDSKQRTGLIISSLYLIGLFLNFFPFKLYTVLHVISCDSYYNNSFYRCGIKTVYAVL